MAVRKKTHVPLTKVEDIPNSFEIEYQ